MTNSEELAYLAGFFDGEGSIGVYESMVKNRPSATTRSLVQALRIGVAGTHRESIARLQRRWGGTMVPENRRTLLPNHKLTWYWTVTGSRAKTVLEQLLPYLSVKREQAALALMTPISRTGYHSTDDERETRHRISQQLKQMKVEVA